MGDASVRRGSRKRTRTVLASDVDFWAHQIFRGGEKLRLAGPGVLCLTPPSWHLRSRSHAFDHIVVALCAREAWLCQSWRGQMSSSQGCGRGHERTSDLLCKRSMTAMIRVGTR